MAAVAHPLARRLRLAVWGVSVAGVVVLAACGGGVREATGDPEPSTTSVAATVVEDTSTTTSEATATTTATSVEEPDATSTSTSTAPPAPAEPGDLGDDPRLDTLAGDCFDGDFAACDQLFYDSPAGSAYEAYGDSCGGRNEPSDLCVDLFGRG